ncbi:MAG: hypothetical protein AAF492_26380, partial [Verrucomicrobiota bacterium]
MAKSNVTGTIEWADWDRLEPVSPIPLKKAVLTPYLAIEDKAELPPPPGHDHGIDDLDSDPPPTSSDGETSDSRTPAHTPEWTNQEENDPGRMLTEQDSGNDAAARKVSLTVSGQISTQVIWYDDEDVDLGDLGNLGDPSPEADKNEVGAVTEHLPGHGVLIDFEDDASSLEDVLAQASDSDTGPGEATGDPENVETPTDPEPPVPHAMAQFILIVGMADA